MIDYQPGDSVIAARDIVCGPVTIDAGTCGIVEYQDRDVCKVQFHKHIVQYNVPAYWLYPVTFAVDGPLPDEVTP